MKNGKVAFFVTGNSNKFREACDVLSRFQIATAMINIEKIEIQDDDLKKIAICSAVDAARKSGLPVFVEDAGLSINVLNGFPGPYSNYVYRRIGTKGILKLMDKIKRRDAYFRSVVAFCDPRETTEPLCFEGTVNGKIVYEERGSQGFGFDPIFEPKGRSGATFAEMFSHEKNRYSHRARALRKFANYFAFRSPQRSF